MVDSSLASSFGEAWQIQADSQIGVQLLGDYAWWKSFIREACRMLKLNEPQAQEFIAELAAKCE